MENKLLIGVHNVDIKQEPQEDQAAALVPKLQRADSASLSRPQATVHPSPMDEEQKKRKINRQR